MLALTVASQSCNNKTATQCPPVPVCPTNGFTKNDTLKVLNVTPHPPARKARKHVLKQHVAKKKAVKKVHAWTHRKQHKKKDKCGCP